MKRVLKDPLFHFIVVGVLLFVGYAWLQPDPAEGEAPDEILLTLDELAQLEILFESKWRRAPTAVEFHALVEDRIREEILYREALALGLDENDTIVRRRMAQKMEFLAEDVAASREPTIEELRTWFGERGDMFALPGRLSFRHLYFSPDQRGSRARDAAAAALARLSGLPPDAQIAEADAFMFQDYYADRTPGDIAREFGPGFAQAVFALPPGSWQGPLESGFGWHVAYVDSVVPGRVPAFEEVEQEVKDAWLGQQKAEAWSQAYEEMRARYTVYLPGPPP